MAGTLLSADNVVVVGQAVCIGVVLVHLVAHHRLQPFAEDTLRVSLNKQAEVALVCQLLSMSLGLVSTAVGADGEDSAAAWPVSVGSIVALAVPVVLALAVKRCARKRQTGKVFPEREEEAPPEEASGGDAQEEGERDALAPGARAR